MPACDGHHNAEAYSGRSRAQAQLPVGKLLPAYRRTVVSIDPAISENPTSNLTGRALRSWHHCRARATGLQGLARDA